MAKQFRDFNEKFKVYTGGVLKFITKQGGHIAKSDIEACISWEAASGQVIDMNGYSASTIVFAVYDAPDAEQWQKFRVGMKGLNTKEKLYALAWYILEAESRLFTSHVRDQIRVGNYLGALRRSGHLDSHLKVVKL